MALVACSPVMVENVELARTDSVPLVSFDRKDNMVVTYGDEDLTMVYDPSDLLYKVKVGKYTLRANGPSFKVE